MLNENKMNHFISEMKADIKLCAISFSVVTFRLLSLSRRHLLMKISNFSFEVVSEVV